MYCPNAPSAVGPNTTGAAFPFSLSVSYLLYLFIAFSLFFSALYMILLPILSISYTYPGIPSISCTSFSDSEELLLLLLLDDDEEEPDEEDESELCFLFFFFFFFFFLSFLRFFLSFFFFSDLSVGALFRSVAGGAIC
jgi:hypothetical protein